MTEMLVNELIASGCVIPQNQLVDILLYLSSDRMNESACCCCRSVLMSALPMCVKGRQIVEVVTVKCHFLRTKVHMCYYTTTGSEYHWSSFGSRLAHWSNLAQFNWLLLDSRFSFPPMALSCTCVQAGRTTWRLSSLYLLLQTNQLQKCKKAKS